MVADSLWQTGPGGLMRVICPKEFDLSAGSIEVAPVYISKDLIPAWGNADDDIKLIINKVFFLYSEATSADAAIVNGLQVGDEASAFRYFAGTSEISKPQWGITEFTQSSTELNEPRVRISTGGQILTVRNLGGKVGAGKVYVGLELSNDYSTYEG